MKVKVTDVRRSLRLLGDSETIITTELKRRKIKGIPRRTHQCVIANFLKTQFPKTLVKVTPEIIIVNGANIKPNRIVQTVITNYDNISNIKRVLKERNNFPSLYYREKRWLRERIKMYEPLILTKKKNIKK